MSDERQSTAASPFAKAEYTAIVSDLHLCEEEPVHPHYPLWKKYKTRQFFFDDEFNHFLDSIIHKAQGKKVELILNGDIFDFDSVTSLPKSPPYRISWLEQRRGLHPQEEKSVYKIKRILNDHEVWVEAVKRFVEEGHKVVFTIGNHDLELHWKGVQDVILKALDLEEETQESVRFCEWFYISNGDTLIEHGNQYDPYCICEDPVNPYLKRYNRFEVRVPFGNLTTKYLINGMGFFNPHLDTNFIMSPKEYVVFFLKYMLRAQPLLLITWFWGSMVVLVQSFIDKLRPPVGDPLSIEDRIENIAKKSNTQPRVVREMKQLFVAPAASYPMIIAKELWLDRALLMVLALLFLYFIFLQIGFYFKVSLFWMFIPFMLFLPFFMFYARSVTSVVHEYKEPQEKILSLTGIIANVTRVVYGHTHVVRHENIGAIEHLNSGTWSPAFMDVECEKPVGQKTYVWIYPAEKKGREAKVFQFKNGREYEVFSVAGRKKERETLTTS